MLCGAFYWVKKEKIGCCLLDVAVGPPLRGPSQLDVLLGPVLDPRSD